MKSIIQTTTKQAGYELIDSGRGEKLERFGDFVLRRPDPQALWDYSLSEDEWKKADAFFERGQKNARWVVSNKQMSKQWNIEFGNLTLKISPTAFKHTGLFPEQLSNWQWMEQKIKNQKSKAKEEIKVLNLFGYTGGATLSCTKAGALVTHVDASKSAIAWGKENQTLSGLAEAPIRWILDDAVDFVKKEIKRGKKYDGILLDPPSFGHGPNGEMWNIEEGFLDLISLCKELLSPTPLFLLINGYSAGYSSIGYLNTILDLKDRFGGVFEHGELCLEENNGKNRLLPSGIFARWSLL